MDRKLEAFNATMSMNTVVKRMEKGEYSHEVENKEHVVFFSYALCLSASRLFDTLSVSLFRNSEVFRLSEKGSISPQIEVLEWSCKYICSVVDEGIELS